MKKKLGAAALSAVMAIVAAAFWVVPVAVADTGSPRIAQPGSSAYGKTLTEWLEIYWRWSYSGADPAQSIVGKVKLLPLPAGEQVAGSWTPADPAVLVGELEITLGPGTPFVLPLAGLIGERYEGYPGAPDDDPAWFENLLAGISPNLTINGRTVVSDDNKAAFYVPATAFDPILTYPEPTSYGAVAGVFFQGIGIVSPPLPVGFHVIRLDETFIVPDFFGQIFHNTWYITVTAH